LNDLYARYKAKGLEILAFPCDQFRQEHGSNADIAAFARGKYGIKFPLFEKIDVNGPNASPVYALLKLHKPGEVRGNFFKYLVDRQGLPISVHGKKDAIDSFETEIVDALLRAGDAPAEEAWSASALADAADATA